MSDTNKGSIQQARINLAAALRWSDRMGLSEGICNHFSLLIPGTMDRFLLNPQGVHWSEIKSSDLVIVDRDGNLIEGKHEVEPTAFFIHARVHQHRPTARCVLHTHMPHATALCCIENGRVAMSSQNALRYFNRIAYDDQYNGLALDEAEGDRICARLGDRDILFLANHGVIVIGQDVACAFDDLYYLEQACRVQVLAQSTNSPLRIVPDNVCRATCEQFASERQQSYLYLAAIQRILLRETPEFAE
jgi:ribulose-5-phosphate 4-epimerase/fuculose-1-phosphate aldolase